MRRTHWTMAYDTRSDACAALALTCACTLDCIELVVTRSKRHNPQEVDDFESLFPSDTRAEFTPIASGPSIRVPSTKRC